MEKLKVSIIIPIYNVEKYLDKCLSSVTEQKYKNIEIICVNDGSKDKSEKIVLKYKEKDKRIVYVKKENGGLSSARNTGIDKATGDYICFVDSDDWISKDYVSKLMDSIIENNSDIAICNIKQLYSDGKEKKVSFKISENKVLNSHDALKELFIGTVLQNHAVNKVYKISLFRDNNIYFPIGKIYEDVFTTYRLFMVASKISLINDYLYFYLQEREGSILSKKFNDKRLDLLDAINEIISNKNLVRYDLEDYIQIFYIKQLIGLFYHIFPYYNKENKSYFKSVFNKIKKHDSHKCSKHFILNSKLSIFEKIKFFILNSNPNLYCNIMRRYLKK